MSSDYRLVPSTSLQTSTTVLQYDTVLRELRKFHFCDKPWVSGFTSKEATAPCGRLVMLLDHVFTRDVTVSISTRTERKSRDVWPGNRRDLAAARSRSLGGGAGR